MLEKSERARRVMKSNSLFCFWHKKGKSRVKRTVLKFSLQLTLLKNELLFAIRSSLFTLLPFALRSHCDESERAKSEFPTLQKYRDTVLICT